MQLYGAGYLNGSSTPTIFNGGTYSVTFPISDVYEAFWTNNRDLSLSYVTPLGANFHAGASFVKSYYDDPPEMLNIPEFVLYNYTASTPSAISQTTNEMRFFVGGNLSEKTSLDLSMYFANANYHVPNPNNSLRTIHREQTSTISIPTTPMLLRALDSSGAQRLRWPFVLRPAAVSPKHHWVILLEAMEHHFALVVSARVTSTNLNLQPEKSFGFDLGTDIKSAPKYGPLV